MPEFYPKQIDDNHYHLWTDVLHARKLSHQTLNKWDRGSYVRWTVIISWTVLEIACQESLNEPNISYSFKRNLDQALSNQNKSPLNWGQGIWQKVIQLQTLRKNYVHRFIAETDLFPDCSVADEAVNVVREAVIALSEHVNTSVPDWIEDDSDRGWETVGLTDVAHASVVKAGASHDDPNSIKVTYVHEGQEHLSDLLSPNTDYQPYVDTIQKNIKVPISEIRVYKGETVIYEKKLIMRGT